MISGQITAQSMSPLVCQGVVHAAEDDGDPLIKNIRVKRSCLSVNRIFPMMQCNDGHIHRAEFSQATTNSLWKKKSGELNMRAEKNI